MTLTLRSAADAAARSAKSNNEAQNARITILLFTRKGLRWTVYAGLLALRVRMKKQWAIRHWLQHPEFAGGLPGIAPSDRLRFSRLQLRGSAGIAPASLSLPRGKTRKPKDISKNGNGGVRNLPGESSGSQPSLRGRIIVRGTPRCRLCSHSSSANSQTRSSESCSCC